MDASEPRPRALPRGLPPEYWTPQVHGSSPPRVPVFRARAPIRRSTGSPGDPRALGSFERQYQDEREDDPWGFRGPMFGP